MPRCVEVAALVIVELLVGVAGVQAQQQTAPPSSVVRQSLDNAWWTGPMLAPSAATNRGQRDFVPAEDHRSAAA
jgi:hypothetical protein